MSVNLSIVVLAAGQGTRMNSVQPKVLQLLAGKPLLHHVLDTAKQLDAAQTLVVCGYKGAELQQACQNYSIDWVWQTEQRGTGHAVQVAYADLQAHSRVVVLYGDVPLIQAKTLQKLIDQTPADAIGILTAKLANPYGLGRMIRNNYNDIVGIVEEKDATEAQRAIKEINSGIYVLPYQHLAAWLANLKPHNTQQEFYLTDIIAQAVAAGVPVIGHQVSNELEILGINSQLQLASIERKYQLTLAQQLMEQGVKLYDPSRLDIRGTVKVGKDVVIDINVLFEGENTLGDGVTVGANCLIKNCVIEAGAVIHANSVLEGAFVGAAAQVGPFARLRPGAKLLPHSKVGNFVEVKNSTIGSESKVNHLSYIGDALLGSKVNVGAGVITCNYDGAEKHQTIIEDEAFIGSNCELIAPVTVGKGATLAAGTTLTENAPANALTLTKKVLSNLLNWQRPVKKAVTKKPAGVK